MANSNDERPVHDLGVPKPGVRYRAGGKRQGALAGRKNALMDTGTIGHVPGVQGSRRDSSLEEMHVHEAPQKSGRVVGTPDLEYGRRPMPREVPMQEEVTCAGRRVRYLDGHSAYVRDRPDMLAEMQHPDTDEEDRHDLRQAIAERDAYHGHVYW